MRGKSAVVLSGGGSRGAYEAGVIQFLRTDLARRMGHQPQVDIITGTSVGAINGTFMAATAHALDTQAQGIGRAWRSLEVEQLISLTPRDVLRMGRVFMGGELPTRPGALGHGGILETSGLERFVLDAVPWRRIRGNVQSGLVHAVSVSATHVGTGRTVVFVEGQELDGQIWSRDPNVIHQSAAIGPRHALASAAIPMLFPAVKVSGEYYVDGGLRQNTPMSPAIRLGADRLLVVSLRHVPTEAEQQALAKEDALTLPKPLFLAGKALNALLLDHTDHDLERLAQLNAFVDAGRRVYGENFESELSGELTKMDRAPLRKIDYVHIRPSRDIGRLASEFVTGGRLKIRNRLAGRLLRRLAESEAEHESDLLSYVLFDGEFADELIKMGYEDARQHENELAALFAVSE